ncbi:MAG: N-acetyltransferase [bacterium]
MTAPDPSMRDCAADATTDDARADDARANDATVGDARANDTVAADATAIRAARLDDVGGIHALLKHFSDRGVLLPRAQSDLYSNLREFIVIAADGEIIACAALQIFTASLGEVRSLAVAPRYERRGLGQRMVRQVEREAQAIGLHRLMALTYAVDFFHKLGFRTVDMRELPEKVWGACINCHKFRNCDEIAVLKNLEPASAQPLQPLDRNR